MNHPTDATQAIKISYLRTTKQGMWDGIIEFNPKTGQVERYEREIGDNSWNLVAKNLNQDQVDEFLSSPEVYRLNKTK